MDSKADQRRLTVKALGSRGLPTLKLPNQRCQAQRFEIADFLFGRALMKGVVLTAAWAGRARSVCTRRLPLGSVRRRRGIVSSGPCSTVSFYGCMHPSVT